MLISTWVAEALRTSFAFYSWWTSVSAIACIYAVFSVTASSITTVSGASARSVVFVIVIEGVTTMTGIATWTSYSIARAFSVASIASFPRNSSRAGDGRTCLLSTQRWIDTFYTLHSLRPHGRWKFYESLGETEKYAVTELVAILQIYSFKRSLN